MKTVALNGIWKYRVGFGDFSDISVPFSRLPVGRSECVKKFDMLELSDKIFLKFDGITYYAEVTLNGVALGEMLPYSEYEFDVTEIVKQKENTLTVVLEDINRAFGPSNGWENFGGIIRDVYLELRGKYYIENVFFKSSLCDNYANADMSIDISAKCPSDAYFKIELFSDGELASSYTQKAGEIVTERVNGVRLWSPDTPKLYSLAVSLICDGEVCDVYTADVGFREFLCDRHRFVLNGKHLFLKGVCKHEMVGDSGHSPSVAEMENDMRMIKEMGCNFVRLVHYPHNKKILEIADRLGLMVSEEPGLWWSDTSLPEVANGSLEVLKRTILRDRNHPSIVFWLCFNECKFTEKFLADSATVCRKYDPTRLVSGANCMTNEETLYHYNKCKFDFYTMHPYSDTFKRSKTSAEILHDKPLLFSEWGGYHVYDNPHLLLDFMSEMKKLYDANSDDGALAGAFFWYFAEVNDYNRGRPACVDGVLKEALVDKYRRTNLIFNAFCEGLKLFDADQDDVAFWLNEAETFSDMSDYIKLESPKDDRFFELVPKIGVNEKHRIRARQIKTGPIFESGASIDKIPVVVSSERNFSFKLGRCAEFISIIGLTSIMSGYPLGGTYGEGACCVSINYKSGKTETISLKNGVHITTAFALKGSSRIDPIATKSGRFAVFGYDKNFEVYVANRLDITVDSSDAIESVSFSADSDKYSTLIYGVFAK